MSFKLYGYELLNDFEKELYDYLEKRELKLGETYYFDEPKDTESISKVIDLYDNNNSYLSNEYHYGSILDYSLIEPDPDDLGMYNEEPPSIGLMTTKPLYPDENWKERKEKSEQKAQQVVDAMPKNLSELQQIQYLYDYVLNNVAPDYEYSNSTDSFSSYSGLILGKAVCAGYSATFELLARTAGFNVITISGDVSTINGLDSHAWNMIEYNGHWYHLDATWDDNSFNYYDYFMLSDEEHNKIRENKDLKYSKDIPVPKADKPLSEREKTSIKREYIKDEIKN